MTDYRNSHSSHGYGESYETAYGPDTFYGQLWEQVESPLLRATLSELHSAGTRSCLDFACGTGRILSVVEDVFDDTTGVDVSESMLEQASHKLRSSELLCADITKNPLDRKFDCATSFRFFRNAQPALRKQAVDALAAHVKPGGKLVVNTHGNPAAPAIALLKAKSRLSDIQANSLSAEELSDLLTAGGFRVEATIPYSYLPRFGNFFPEWYATLLTPAERLRDVPLLKSMSESTILVAERR